MAYQGNNTNNNRLSNASNKVMSTLDGPADPFANSTNTNSFASNNPSSNQFASFQPNPLGGMPMGMPYQQQMYQQAQMGVAQQYNMAMQGMAQNQYNTGMPMYQMPMNGGMAMP